ncbi:mechanosensitive ion channel family protein [Actinomyces sp. oral taxon 170]|uniref:mechanosensitive ion channel family protein n=1 Tax=Actinomyces sp. oral taxon 170 TaxID=712117 RepID=UPI00055816CB|nr:mechanosensitive ion channel domain-containing protein [Actinomyces sp. oral taxon 170]
MLLAATTPPATPGADPSANPSVSPTPTPSGPTGVPSVDVDETVKVVTKTTSDLATIAWQAGLGAAIGIVVAFVAVAILRFMGRRRLLYREIVEFGRRPAFAVGAMTGAFLGTQVALTGLRHTKSDSTTMVVIERGVTIALIFAVTWLVVAFAKAVESTVVKGVQASENQGRANRVTTQSQIIRRVTQVVIIIAGLVSAIMTFPSVQLAMGSLLASAGLASVIAGMAARSMLGNVFAGLQLATTDAIRVDDVVVVGDEQGTIEEITLTYVVMRTWDDRRLILPSTHFTENPFANWTRGGSQSTGTFTLDLDWRVPIASLRAELARLVAASTAWDGRQASLEVSDAVSGYVTVRVVLTGADPGDVGALKSYVREELVAWLQREAPYALPRTRVEVEQVEVTQDLSPEQVARTAEEIVAKQKAEADGAATVAAGGSATAEAPATTEAAGESAAHGLGARRAVTLGRAMGRSLLHRARRGGLGPR